VFDYLARGRSLTISIGPSQAFFNILINNSYGPLLHALPLSLADKAYRDESNARSGGRKSDEIGLKNKDGVDVEREYASDDSEEDGYGYGFAHPAVSRPQRVVWMPQDRLGLGEEEERVCREAGIEASVAGALMDGKGNVDVVGRPSDEGRF
jgi:hypothetical protein